MVMVRGGRVRPRLDQVPDFLKTRLSRDFAWLLPELRFRKNVRDQAHPPKKRAFTSRAYRIDASTIVFITPMLVLLETQSLRSHALYLFTEYVDPVVEQRVLRLLCIAGT
jgi:hypothetical protein